MAISKYFRESLGIQENESRLYFISCSPGNMVLTFNTKKSLSLSAGVKIILLRKEDLSHVPSAHFDKVLSLKPLITTDGKLFNFFYYFSENIRPGIYCLKCLPNRNTKSYHHENIPI